MIKLIKGIPSSMFKIVRWNCYPWLPEYLRQQRLFNIERVKNNSEVHVIFLIVDHFEPSKREGVEGVKKVRDWCERYERLTDGIFDSDGVRPRHTWFYRYDYPNYECIKILNEYVFKGMGEIEFHLHHGNDISESFTKTIEDGVKWFNQAGAMIAADSSYQKNFAYIAGNWALDNGRNDPAFSGVNNELEILYKAGCYADFTFPAFGTSAQPKKVNSIYYAKDTPEPKSYDTGRNVVVGTPSQGDLMIFQGPLYIDWQTGYMEYASLESFTPYFTGRIDYWLNAGIHVHGRPEWIFMKLHTHGMQHKDVFLSTDLTRMFSDLAGRFTSPPFKLHFVTAREAYNIVKAAEAGKSGNPNIYRDYLISKPLNRKALCNIP